MYVSHDCQLVYFSPPRTGSVAFSIRLSQSPFNARMPAQTKHHDAFWDKSLDDYTTVITVRHPYVRAVSFWRYSCLEALRRGSDPETQVYRQIFSKGLPSLEGFLRFPVLQTGLNTIWRCSWHQERVPRPIDHVIHLERFDADVARVPQLQGTVFPRLNSGPVSNQPWHSFFTKNPVCLELVQKLWADDFDEFGYVRDLDACIAGKLFVDELAAQGGKPCT